MIKLAVNQILWKLVMHNKYLIQFSWLSFGKRNTGISLEIIIISQMNKNIFSQVSRRVKGEPKLKVVPECFFRDRNVTVWERTDFNRHLMPENNEEFVYRVPGAYYNL